MTSLWNAVLDKNSVARRNSIPGRRSSILDRRSSTLDPCSSILDLCSSILDLCSSIPYRRYWTLDPFSSNPPHSSISDRRYSTLDRTLHVPRSPFLCPRSNISTPCSSNWFSLRISTRATTPRSYTPEKPRFAPPLLNHRPSMQTVRDSFCFIAHA